MFYSDKLKKPVRLKSIEKVDGEKVKKVRGFVNPETKAFEAVD